MAKLCIFAPAFCLATRRCMNLGPSLISRLLVSGSVRQESS
jgi:hypothetical protein